MLFKQPVTIPISDKLYMLIEPYEYRWQHGINSYKLVIPRGFETDIASVPRWVWSLFGILPDGLHRAAAVLHDFLYRYNKPHGERLTGYYFKLDAFGLWQDISHYPWSRKQCDRLFMRVMREAGTVKWKRRAMFWAVRAVGWYGWDR